MLIALFARQQLVVSSIPIACYDSAPVIVRWVFTKLIDSSSTSLIEPVCDNVKRVIQLDPQDLFLTNGVVGGRNAVCISDDVASPCQVVIANFDSSISDPRTALSKVFEYQNVVDLNSPIQESIERLLIRPADIIDIEPIKYQEDQSYIF